MPNTNNELTQPQQIVNPRLKLFSVSLFASSTAIILWSIVAKIPVTSQAIGYILPPGKLSTISASDSGRIYLLDRKSSDELYSLIVQLEQSYKSLESLSSSENIGTLLQSSPESEDTRRSQLKKIEDLLLLTNKIILLGTLQSDTGEKPTNSGSGMPAYQKQSVASLRNPDSCFEQHRPIFNIIDIKRSDSVLSAVQQAKGSLFKLKTQLSWIKQYGAPRQAIASAYGTRAQAAQSLVKKQILTQDRYLTLQGEYLGSLATISKLVEDTQSQFLALVDSYDVVKNKFSSWKNSSLVLGDQPSTCVLQQITPDGTQVKAQDAIAIAAPTAFANFQQSPSSIPFFYKATEDRGIRNGDDVVVYPTNVPRSKYGGIPGKVLHSGQVLTDKNAALWVTGLSAIQPFANSDVQSTLYYGIIGLRNSDTSSGYKWTTGDGPSFELLLGTSANVEVTVSMVPPISYLVPFLREISGQ